MNTVLYQGSAETLKAACASVESQHRNTAIPPLRCCCGDQPESEFEFVFVHAFCPIYSAFAAPLGPHTSLPLTRSWQPSAIGEDVQSIRTYISDDLTADVTATTDVHGSTANAEGNEDKITTRWH